MLDSVRTPPASTGRSAPGTDAPRAAASPAAATSAGEHGNLKSPDWVKDAVFYQVFPDRFRNGNVANDPKGTAPWGDAPQNETWFQGGDLDGLADKVGHLTKLGVNALYLNPIFTAPSNHKYDTTDYANVDPAFGGNEAFSKLIDKAHASGVKVMLDGSFNHTSHEHVWFKDVKEKGRESKYWDYYNVHRHPITTRRDEKGVLRSDDYEGWGKPEWGGPYATLPVLKNTHPEVMDGLVTGTDSVIRKWLRDGKIDGWRMDVADEVEPEVWREARKVIKGENPNAYMLGENWQDASEMVAGDQFDGVMNYKYFQQPATEFFGQKKINADQFMERLKNPYSREARLSMLNILETHDTPRFITQAGGDWYRARPAAIFQMTYQGAPSIYYGAELGMEGGPDPDSRRAYDWKAAERLQPVRNLDGAHPEKASGQQRANEMFGLYQRLIETRKGSEALRRGEFAPLATHNEDQTLAYRRWVPGSDAKDAVVALNNNVVGRAIQVPVSEFAPDGTAYVDALSGAKHVVQGGRLDLGEVDGNWGAVLLREG